MAIAEGYKGEMTYSRHASDTKTALSVASIFAWRLNWMRRMVNVTLLNKSVLDFLYEQTTAVVDFKSYIDQDNAPGQFNINGAATLILFPSGADVNKRWTVSGFVEEMRIEVGIGMPNIMTGKIRGALDLATEPVWTT